MRVEALYALFLGIFGEFLIGRLRSAEALRPLNAVHFVCLEMLIEGRAIGLEFRIGPPGSKRRFRLWDVRDRISEFHRYQERISFCG